MQDMEGVGIANARASSSKKGSEDSFKPASITCCISCSCHWKQQTCKQPQRATDTNSSIAAIQSGRALLVRTVQGDGKAKVQRHNGTACNEATDEQFDCGETARRLSDIQRHGYKPLPSISISQDTCRLACSLSSYQTFLCPSTNTERASRHARGVILLCTFPLVDAEVLERASGTDGELNKINVFSETGTGKRSISISQAWLRHPCHEEANWQPAGLGSPEYTCKMKTGADEYKSSNVSAE